MTVLEEYQRLEAEGVWRAAPDDQRLDVIVTIGEATITVNTPQGQALTHWSLPAMRCLNPGKVPAVYCPGADATETLEIFDPEMNDAINRVLSAIEKMPGKKSWIRRLYFVGLVSVMALGLSFWLPNAIANYTARLIPFELQKKISDDLLEETSRLAGSPCHSVGGDQALAALGERLFPGNEPKLVVLPSTLKGTAKLPDGTFLISHMLVEDFETPDVLAGFLLLEENRSIQKDPFAQLLQASPFRASLAVLSTGNLREKDTQRMAEWLMVRQTGSFRQSDVIEALQDRHIATAPFGRAFDFSGETTNELILASTPNAVPALGAENWSALQSICAD